MQKKTTSAIKQPIDNLNPDAKVQNPKLTFYHPLLIVDKFNITLNHR